MPLFSWGEHELAKPVYEYWNKLDCPACLAESVLAHLDWSVIQQENGIKFGLTEEHGCTFAIWLGVQMRRGLLAVKLN